MAAIFISYSRKDSAFATRLAADLQQAGHTVWQDLTNLRGGQDWIAAIDQAIKGCDTLVLVLSPDGIASPWVQDEVARARNLGKPIIPVLLKPVADLPFYLTRIQQIDFQSNRQQAMTQLLAALGAPLPPLVQTSQRRLWIGGLAVLLLIVAFLTLPFAELRQQLQTLGGAPPVTAPSTLAVAPSASPTASATAPAPPQPTFTLTADATATKAAQGTEIALAVEATQKAQPTTTPLPAPTQVKATPTNTPHEPPPTPTLATCSRPVAAELANLWQQARIGCPKDQGKLVWASWTPYERGQMLWRDDTDKQIYGFFNSGRWQAVTDTWDGQSPTPSRGDPPAGLFTPIRGTGHVWGTNDTFFQELGWATAPQKGFCAFIQNFEQGFILRSSRVPTCKDNLFNQATANEFPLDFIEVKNGESWHAGMR